MEVLIMSFYDLQKFIIYCLIGKIKRYGFKMLLEYSFLCYFVILGVIDQLGDGVY